MFAYILLFFTLLLAPTEYTEEWKKIASKDGVEVYVLHKPSKISSSVSTVVKLKNTNSYQVKVIFNLSITCGHSSEAKAQGKKSVILAPNDESSLHHYKACQSNGATEATIKLLEFTVTSL
ncbi:hypothetical protein R9C00_22490 [Flammeovirgaceae bacterium SG7u.111]|nr:hypothetical protein [Flammeovirgaceae bacterium SG7u.132]WPO34473.1 hypothetical protein R9C00_22490 [Flammeovirgaceae bacterium SG7u.111]